MPLSDTPHNADTAEEYQQTLVPPLALYADVQSRSEDQNATTRTLQRRDARQCRLKKVVMPVRKAWCWLTSRSASDATLTPVAVYRSRNQKKRMH
jgi:hypothetical protein